MKEYFPFSKAWEILKGGHSDIFSLKGLLLNWTVCVVMGLCPTYCNQQERGLLKTQFQLQSLFGGVCPAR